MGRKPTNGKPAPKRLLSRGGAPETATPQPSHDDGPSDPPASTGFPVVGIGASAGGLEAFSQFLRELPADTGMAFVLVQHLDPKHESQLAEVLSRTTPMPVLSVTDGLRVEPDRVYVMPPNTDMTIGRGAFALTPRDNSNRHTPIDHFFRSLAQELAGRAIGVVLSGTGADGTLGLRAIKAEGGITLVQDEKSAKHAGMPHSAAASADVVLPPAGLARELVRIAGHPYVNRAHPAATETNQPEDGTDVRDILRVLRNATGIDFSQYKPASVRRRIARRMLLKRIDDHEAYVGILRHDPLEAQALRDELLIQVTGFFRDPEGYEALRRSVFPKLLQGRADDEPIRIWVPGCATGEEAYSLVICLLEFLGERDGTNAARLPIQMFATDLSALAVTQARAGTFPVSIESEVSPERLQRFFSKTDGRYRISHAIRDACVFAQQDLTRDPPFSKLDLISCCNLLIYLGAPLQERVIPVLHYALKPSGFLKLGASESVGRLTSLFSIIDKKHKIYARNPGPSSHFGFGVTRDNRFALSAGPRQQEEDWSAPAIEKEADRVVIGRYAPAGVVINANMDIVQFRGKTGPYLEATPGTASLNLFKMAREGLGPALRQAVRAAVMSGGARKAEGLRIKANDGFRNVSLEVIPLGSAERAKGRHHLVLFLEERKPSAESPKRARTGDPAARVKTTGRSRITQLTQELADANQQLLTITEEHEAAVQELSAVTEEAQSSNEELQSTNEELETAKEELQATNEELTTVNDELNNRNLELGQLSSDLGNLLVSTHVPIIMVGSDLRVRRMTPVTGRVLNLAPSDVGRPIRDLLLSIEIPDLEALLREVMETLSVRDLEAQARDGSWYSVRVRPYRTADNRIDGAVISFLDIDALKRGLEEAKAARNQSKAIVETVREPLVILDADLRVVTANPSFYEMFQVSLAETEGRRLYDLGNHQWDIPQLRTVLEEVLPRNSVVEGFQVEHTFETIGRRTMLLNARRMLSAAGEQAQILLAIEDITERMLLEADRAAVVDREKAATAHAQAATLAKDQFVAVLSHELRTPLNAMLGWVRLLRNAKLDEGATAHGLEVIERNTLLQARLIEDLLDVSRIVAGKISLEPRPVMVAPAVEAAIHAVGPVAEAKGVRLEGHLDASAGPVLGDPTRLQQIVWNLLSNAIKFTLSGGRVEVRLLRRGSDVEISVRDSGMGITSEQLPQLFDLFGAAHTRSRAVGGLGLGLAIVRHLVELHGGVVRAESAGPGQGSTFTVRLPVTDERPSDEAESPNIRGLESSPALEGVRVLVVDDEEDARGLIREILARCGAEVTTATSAREAMEALKRRVFDVLISDIAMPGEDGYELIRKVRALDPGQGGQIPALALTAYARIEDRADAIAAGYQQHAAKPIEPAELAAAVATLARPQ